MKDIVENVPRVWIVLSGVNTEILKKGALTISNEGGPIMVAGDLLESYGNYTPGLAKNPLAQCCIKLFFIAEIH